MSEPRTTACSYCGRTMVFVDCAYPMWVHVDGFSCDGEPERHGEWVPQHGCEYDYPQGGEMDTTPQCGICGATATWVAGRSTAADPDHPATDYRTARRPPPVALVFACDEHRDVPDNRGLEWRQATPANVIGLVQQMADEEDE